MAAAAAMGGGGAAARAADVPSRPRFVVVQPTSTERIPPGAVAEAVVAELARRGLDVVPASALSAEEKACGAETCWGDLLVRKGASHVVVMRFARPDANEQSDADVTIAASARGGWRDASVYEAHVRDAFSLPRTFTTRMAEAAGELASRVAARAAQSPAPSLAENGREGTAPEPAAARAPLWKTLAPWGVVAAGGATMAVGVGWLATNGNEACSEDPCRRVYDTRTVGWSLVGAGAAVAALGVGWGIYLLHGEEREASRNVAARKALALGLRDVALSTDLRSLSLRGAF